MHGCDRCGQIEPQALWVESVMNKDLEVTLPHSWSPGTVTASTGADSNNQASSKLPFPLQADSAGQELSQGVSKRRRGSKACDGTGAESLGQDQR